MAWAGGKMTSNKEAALKKFLARQKSLGKSVDEALLTAARSSSSGAYKVDESSTGIATGTDQSSNGKLVSDFGEAPRVGSTLDLQTCRNLHDAENDGIIMNRQARRRAAKHSPRLAESAVGITQQVLPMTTTNRDVADKTAGGRKDLQKQLRNCKKKLRGIQRLEEDIRTGKQISISDDQQAKLERKKGLETRIAELEKLAITL